MNTCIVNMPIPVAVWSMPSLVGIAGSNPAGGAGGLSLVVVVCCQVEVFASDWSHVQRSSAESDVSSWVCSWILDNEEALAH